MGANMKSKNPPMISEGRELLALQNGVLERKKDPTGARRSATVGLLAPGGTFLQSKTQFWNARSSPRSKIIGGPALEIPRSVGGTHKIGFLTHIAAIKEQKSAEMAWRPSYENLVYEQNKYIYMYIYIYAISTREGS